MKTLRIFLIVAISFLTVQLNGQIKLLSNGVVGLGSTVPSGFNVSLYGRYFYIGTTGYGGYNMIKMDCGNVNPRIWSPSGSIVFYNNDAGGFQDIQVRTCYQNSDINAKTNINSLTKGLDKVKQLRGVTYNWKASTSFINADQSKPAKLEYGLIAQEVEKVVPELVMTNDSTQGKMLSYTGVIPILIEAIKDLSAQVDVQKQQIEALKGNGSNLKSAKVATDINPTNESVATLLQNSPNPFNQSTVIGYFLSEATQKATLYIYDMNGSQLKNIPINQRGSGNVTINGSEFRPGMYLYTLIVDGQVIDTKRMILTE